MFQPYASFKHTRHSRESGNLDVGSAWQDSRFRGNDGVKGSSRALSRTFRRALVVGLLLVASPALAQDASILNPSGLPIPRYVSLKSNEVNVRVGPGKRYPVRWIYRRAGLPVQIVEEFAHWRKIKDFEGASGWVHKGLLAGERTALIMDKPQNLYPKPEVSSQPIVRAAPLVIARIDECRPDWCRLQISGVKAWIRKADIWGISREEVFEE